MLAALDWLRNFEGSLVVVGDAPFISASILQELLEAQQKDNRTVAGFLTVKMEPPPPWGRVVRNGDGQVLRIVEEKNASGKEKRITEVSSSHYCFYWDCLYRALHYITDKNAQNEFYLPDVIAILVSNGETVFSVSTEDKFLPFGINTPEELALAESEMRSRIVTADRRGG